MLIPSSPSSFFAGYAHRFPGATGAPSTRPGDGAPSGCGSRASTSPLPLRAPGFVGMSRPVDHRAPTPPVGRVHRPARRGLPRAGRPRPAGLGLPPERPSQDRPDDRHPVQSLVPHPPQPAAGLDRSRAPRWPHPRRLVPGAGVSDDGRGAGRPGGEQVLRASRPDRRRRPRRLPGRGSPRPRCGGAEGRGEEGAPSDRTVSTAPPLDDRRPRHEQGADALSCERQRKRREALARAVAISAAATVTSGSRKPARTEAEAIRSSVGGCIGEPSPTRGMSTRGPSTVRSRPRRIVGLTSSACAEPVVVLWFGEG